MGCRSITKASVVHRALPSGKQGEIEVETRCGGLSCTRLRVPPVALHVARYTCRS